MILFWRKMKPWMFLMPSYNTLQDNEHRPKISKIRMDSVILFSVCWNIILLFFFYIIWIVYIVPSAHSWEGPQRHQLVISNLDSVVNQGLWFYTSFSHWRSKNKYVFFKGGVMMLIVYLPSRYIYVKVAKG